jgi:hypothetical protein
MIEYVRLSSRYIAIDAEAMLYLSTLTVLNSPIGFETPIKEKRNSNDAL